MNSSMKRSWSSSLTSRSTTLEAIIDGQARDLVLQLVHAPSCAPARWCVSAFFTIAAACCEDSLAGSPRCARSARRVAEPTISAASSFAFEQTLGIFRCASVRPRSAPFRRRSTWSRPPRCALSEHFAHRLEQELLDDQKRDERIAHRHEDLPPADADESLVNACCTGLPPSRTEESVPSFVLNHSLYSDAVVVPVLYDGHAASIRTG